MVLLICIFAGKLLAHGISDASHLPGPDVEIELPPELIGVFEFIYETSYGRHDFYGEIEIYENNKYHWRGGESAHDWGHVIEEDGNYYLLPLGSLHYGNNRGYYIREKTIIVLTEDCISFTPVGGMENMTFVAVRKDEDNPRPKWVWPEGTRLQ
jgi:hypothetical protein